MENKIPFDGTNINDATAEKDPMSLLIMRQAYLDLTNDTEKKDADGDNEVADGIEEETLKR